MTNADARGATEVAQLLRADLAQEEAARDKVKEAAKRIATQGIAVQPAAS